MGQLFRNLGARRFAAATALALVAGLMKTAMVAVLWRLVESGSALEFALLGVLLVGTAIGEVFAVRTLSVAAERLTLDLRTSLLRSVLRAPLRDLEQASLPTLRELAGRDAATLSMGVGTAPLLLMNLLLVTGILVLLFFVHPAVGLIFVVGVVLGAVVIGRVQAAYMGQIAEANALADVASGLFDAQVRAGGPLRLNPGRADAVMTETVGNWAQARDKRVRARTLQALTQGGTTLCVFVVIGAVLACHPLLGLAEEELLAFAFLAVFFIGPVTQAVAGFQAVLDALEAFRRFSRETSALPMPEETGAALAGPLDELELEGVEYDYEHFHLGPVSFRLRRRDTLFIVGGNGSGKSTLLKILLGLYQPSAGTIRWNGEAIASGSSAYRESFAYLPFEFVLFGRLFGRAGIDDEVADWVGRLHLDSVASYSEESGWSSTRLSQGQRRRLALIDALAEHRPILVLDEYAADQDPASRRYFYEQLLPELKAKGLTLVIVTHDDRYFHMADHILRLERGRSALVDEPPAQSVALAGASC